MLGFEEKNNLFSAHRNETEQPVRMQRILRDLTKRKKKKFDRKSFCI